MARQSTTCKITSRIATAIDTWCERFRQGIILRFKGKEFGYDTSDLLRGGNPQVFTIRKATLYAIATDLAYATLCPLRLIVNAMLGQPANVAYALDGVGMPHTACCYAHVWASQQRRIAYVGNGVYRFNDTLSGFNGEIL